MNERKNSIIGSMKAFSNVANVPITLLDNHGENFGNPRRIYAYVTFFLREMSVNINAQIF